jgi:hypothetical protein
MAYDKESGKADDDDGCNRTKDQFRWRRRAGISF